MWYLMNKIKYALMAGLSSLAFGSGVVAQDGDDQRQIEEIIVTTPYQRQQFDLLQSTSVLSEEAIKQNLETNIGETLASLPGIESSYFGPGAGRPIIRGQGGDRLLVLVDGIGSIDASNTSPDHAVAGELITAERVEVLRGPASLLFGSSAAGGVVNVIDGRIPSKLPEDGVNATFFSRYGTNDDEASFAGSATFALGQNVAVHADGFYRDTGNIKVPGFALSDAAREEELEEGADEDEFEFRRIGNTDIENYGGAFGVSSIFERGFLGVSVNVTENEYGVPIAEEHGHGEEEGKEEEEAPIRIDLEQVRLDLKGALDFDGIFEQAKLRFSYGDYEHRELEGDEVGTTFLNDGFEGRLELVQRARGGWKGALGVQVRQRDFEAIGDEAFIPPNKTWQAGFFTLQEYNFAHWIVEASGRLETLDIENSFLNTDQKFTPFSVALGLSHLWNDWLRAGVQLYRTERAPSAEELFSNGPHFATNSFEVGNETLRKEEALGGEFSIRANRERVQAGVTVFFTDYDNFIVQRLTGEEEDGLPILAYSGTNARFWGIEAEADATLYDGDAFDIVFDLGADFVRASDRGIGEPLPRIPAKSATLGLEGQSEFLDGRIDVELVDTQDRISAFETPTSGYALLNLGLTYRPFGDESDLSFSLQARNLTDEEARRHTSFLKEILPLPGRNFRLSARYRF